ncbi:MAG TPA: hypothetical protein VK540_19915 [Polyangiaceae bacterium]|nr:hypothetical protein [Polyangiaceae bacterium]
MSRKRWQVSRALRVLVACIALWLPAHTASASFGPADTVVMVAGAAGTAEVARAHRDATREARAEPGAPAASSVVARPERVEPLPDVNRTVVERRYLRHCALLC